MLRSIAFLQWAEKFHAYTRPRGGHVNTRSKDLVDLILLINLGELSSKPAEALCDNNIQSPRYPSSANFGSASTAGMGISICTIGGSIGSQHAGPKVAAILSIVESCRRLKIPLRDYPGCSAARLG